MYLGRRRQMREIKFRAPHPDTGQYYYFTFYPRAGSDLPGVPAWGTDWMGTVERFTGRLDKDGWEIYEPLNG